MPCMFRLRLLHLHFLSFKLVYTAAPSSMAGIATHYIPQNRLESLVERLAELDSPSMEIVNEVVFFLPNLC